MWRKMREKTAFDKRAILFGPTSSVKTLSSGGINKSRRDSKKFSHVASKSIRYFKKLIFNPVRTSKL